MKYALIGCGRISPNHLAAAQANKLEIVGLCDVDDAMIEDKMAKFKLDETKVSRYNDYQLMLDEQKPELVSICTESGKHAAIALECIRR
ncbi:MAG: gfo/Idh/MocA family oxidoreductase, partial [Spirochaetia bacterium]|nr:gfo/Idh/MocA family oxidoreductase [Spirochaetia bacterium]